MKYRHPMSKAHRREVALFDAAMDLPPEQRAAYLDQSCGDDTALRQRIESLLKASESQCEFLDSPRDPQLSETLRITVPPSEKPGDRIGRYKLLQQIGEGGCGVVYMAEQEEPICRRVALKIIKLGMDTKTVIARFEAERQALALMDHPSIAKVFDAGATETGRPYFVMELVRGIKITDFCDEKKLSTRARLDLFIQVCAAVQHAHQKGIIHRDLKPSNILVSMNDGRMLPKIIDFGIAKAASDQKLTNKTLFTAFEQFIGTPAYMSPEQAVITNVDIDTRSDIYALGVLLYELLTGKTPFDPKDLMEIGLDEMRRTIRETEPPRPSTRVSTLSGQELSTTAQRRGLEAPALVSDLRGDLDWIVMKCLEKDRARRYETANGLAMDIQRHLDNEPVVARPASRLYRFQKLVRRNKLTFVAVGAVGASLVIGLTLSTVLFFRERAARERANEQAAIAKAVDDFLQEDLLRQASSYSQAEAGFAPDPDLTVRQALERAAERIEDRFKNQPLEEAAVRHSIGNALLGLGRPERALPHLQRAFELRRAKLGRDRAETLNSMGRLAWAYLLAGKLDQALPLQEETVKLQKANRVPDHVGIVNSMVNLALVYRSSGKRDQATLLEEETLILAKAKLGLNHQQTLVLMANLAKGYRDAGRLDLALPLLEQTLELMKANLGTGNPFTQNVMSGLAHTYCVDGKFDQALVLLEQALKLSEASRGLDHPDTHNFRHRLADMHLAAGEIAEAQPFLRELAERGDALDWNYSAWRLATSVDSKLRDGPTAVILAEKAVAATKRQDPNILDTLAAAYAEVGQFANAIRIQREALVLERDEGLKQVWTDRLKLYESNSPYRDVAADTGRLAESALWLLQQKKFKEAEILARDCLAIREQHIPANWLTFDARSLLGGSLLGQKKYAEAEPLLLSAYQGLRQRQTQIPAQAKPRIREALQRLVQLNEATGRPVQVTEWKQKLAEFDKPMPPKVQAETKTEAK